MRRAGFFCGFSLRVVAGVRWVSVILRGKGERRSLGFLRGVTEGRGTSTGRITYTEAHGCHVLLWSPICPPCGMTKI